MKKWFILSALFMLFASCSTEQNVATLLYFNDAHEISPVNDQLGSRGGIARLKTVIDSIRESNSETLLLFGGDLGGGTLFGAVYKGFPMVEAFNLIAVDIANFGQHDFDFGPQITRKLVQNSKFQWLTSNLVDENKKPFAGLPSHLVKSFRNIKIGFIALTDAMNTTTYSKQISQKPLLSSAYQAIKNLKEKKVDLIVALTQTDRKMNEQLLIQMKEIDLIFSEENYENSSTIYYIGHRPIITPCGNMGSLIQVDIKKSAGDISIHLSVHPVDESVPEDDQLADFQNLYQDSLEKKLSQPIAETIQFLDAGVNSDFKCRWTETNIGNLITDSYRDYHRANIAVLNGGGIRDNIAKGWITLRDTWSVLPFGNKVCLIRISGKDILHMLEHGVASVESHNGAFLQISGAKYRYSREKNIGQRITSVSIGNSRLKLDQLYTLALPDFILNGGNDYTFLSKVDVLVPAQEAPRDIDIFSDYCREKKIIDYSVEGRITIIE